MNGKSKSAYRADIDGLRAIAILSVVLFHVGVPFVTGGFVGVDVFFVISGYLISSHIYRDLESGTYTLRSFYEKRARRILPALLAVISACIFAGCLLLAPGELQKFSAQVISALTSTSNIFFWLRTSYFASHAELKPLLMTWSLGVEEQFYLIFPLMAHFLWRRYRTHLFASLAGLSLLSFLFSIWQVAHYPTASFFLLSSRWWELGLGTLLGLFESSRRELPAGWNRPLVKEIYGAVGLISILASALVYNSQTLFPGLAALLPAGGALLLLAAPQSWVNRKILSLPPLVSVGLISYSLYLWHWPVLSFSYICSGDILSPTGKVFLIALSFLLAFLSYKFIEQPFRRMQLTSRTLPRYALLNLLCLLPACSLFFLKGWPSRYPAAAVLEAAAHEPSIETCTAQDGQVSARRGGRCSPKPGLRVVAVMGDSHAASLDRYLQPALLSRGLTVAEFTKSSCPQLGGIAAGSSEWKDCVAFNQSAMTAVTTDPNIKTVVLAGYWLTLFPPLYDGGRYLAAGQTVSTTSAEQSWSNLEAGITDVVNRLQSSGKEIILVVDSPSLDFNPLLLSLSDAIAPRRAVKRLLWGTRFSSDEVAHPEGTSKQRLDGFLKQLASSHHIQVIDLYAGLCSESACRYAGNGQPYFEDFHHLTRLGAEQAMGRSIGIFGDAGERASAKTPDSATASVSPAAAEPRPAASVRIR